MRYGKLVFYDSKGGTQCSLCGNATDGGYKSAGGKAEDESHNK